MRSHSPRNHPCVGAHELRHERRDEALFEVPGKVALDRVPSDARVVRERVVRRDYVLETSRPRS